MADRPQGRSDHPVNSIRSLAISGEDRDAILGHIGRLGLQTLEGWDAAGTSLADVDERINPVDQFQYDAKSGPCFDAATGGAVEYFDGQTEVPRWREFSEVAADAEIYSVASFPLKLDGEVLGALNFYSRERDALRPGQREEGFVFAAQAAVALAHASEFAAQGTQIQQLEEGLQTRTMIGQATGLLMAQEGLTSEDAFQRLVKVSQNANVKLREIAQRYVEAWEKQAEGSTNN